MSSRIRAIDLFSGAGGSSWGARSAGVEICASFDLWELAGKVHQDNFPESKFFNERLETISDWRIRQLGHIDLILASPECTNHSPAKGNKPRCEKSRETAFQVLRYARILKPRWIVIENVVSMRNWHRYNDLISGLEDLGYYVNAQVLNSADFGVPQRRRRLFLLCDRESPSPTLEPRVRNERSAKQIIDMNGGYNYTSLHSPKRARATLQRAERAFESIGKKQPFLIVYYGSDHAGGWQELSQPLRTITTLDRFAFVRPRGHGHEMRMLQVPELKAAMGMSKSHTLNHGSRRDQIKMIGNAVCPPVMRRAVTSLINNR